MNLQSSILKVLAYFDLFHYPVTKEEIHRFLDRPATPGDLNINLLHLMDMGIVHNVNDYYTLQKDASLVSRRLSDNARAQKLLLKAERISRFLYRFPYVRGVGISGSLSKNVADEHADIDYFVITKANRLWIARTIMHFFKKLTFITGHQHWFCMNYFVDEKGLEIEEKNIFTATEMVTLLPMFGEPTFKKFIEANQWPGGYFPNQIPKKIKPELPRSSLKKIFEKLFDLPFGEKFDNYLMRLTASRWSEKERMRKLNVKGNRMGLKTGKHFCKPNPSFFHERVLSRFNNLFLEVSLRWENEKQEYLSRTQQRIAG